MEDSVKYKIELEPSSGDGLRMKSEDDTSTVGAIHAQDPNVDLGLMEKVWAKDFFEKTSDERESLLDELHGVSTRAVKEAPEMIAYALALFQETIDNTIPDNVKRAYTRACSMNSTYVHSINFRLKFLRAELFHIWKAAVRYCQNLDYLLDKFGDYALMRQLYMSDLNQEEMRFLKRGYMQIMPFRDRAGRMILANLGSYGGFEFSWETKQRVGIYVCFALLADDVATQQKGAISLGLLSTEALESMQNVSISEYNRFNGAMPVRISGHHACLPDEIRFRILKVMLLSLTHGDVRHVTRIHIGSQIECDYKLRSFGIPTEFIPRSFTGKIKDNYLKALLKTRLAAEDHRKAQACGDYIYYYSANAEFEPFPGIECPQNNCFLVRKHGVAWNHPGNIEMRAFLEEKELEHGRRRLDEEYISIIVDEMNARSFQILLFDEENSWYKMVTTKESIHKHVWRAMRDNRKRQGIRKSDRSQQNINCAADYTSDDRGSCCNPNA